MNFLKGDFLYLMKHSSKPSVPGTSNETFPKTESTSSLQGSAEPSSPDTSISNGGETHPSKIDADDADKGGEQAEAVSVRKTRYQKDRQNVGQRDVGSRVFERMKKAERDGRGGTHEKQGKSPALYVCRKRTEFFDDRAGLEPIF